MSEIKVGITLEGYEFLEMVEMRRDSSVYRVRSVKFETLFLAKVTFVDDGDVDLAWETFDREISALMRLDHPNIISLYAHFRYGPNFVLILEYCPEGSMKDYMKRNGPVPTVILIRVIKGVCSALRYAWSQGVHHRNINPANIMFNEKGTVKLVDFGTSLITERENERAESRGFRLSPTCAAPEVISKVMYDPGKADIWSFGVTILWLAKGSMPWGGSTVSEVKRLINTAKYDIPDDVDPHIAEMVKNMIVVLPRSRSLPADDNVGLGSSSVPVHRPRLLMRGCTSQVSSAPAAETERDDGVRAMRMSSQLLRTMSPVVESSRRTQQLGVPIERLFNRRVPRGGRLVQTEDIPPELMFDDF